MWIYGWRWPRKLGGCKSETGGEGGCLCTISLNKAIVVSARSKEQQGPLAEKGGNVTNPVSLILADFSILYHYIIYVVV